MGATERVVQFIDYKGVSKYKFCKNLGFSNKFLDNSSNMGTDKAGKILHYYPEINPEWLLTGKEPMLKENNIVNEPDLSYNRTKDKGVPFYDVDFIAGGLETFDNQTIMPEYYMDIPEFKGCTAFRAYSDSMEKIIKSGSILFGNKIENWHEHLEYGQIYGIVATDGRRYLKYIRKYAENAKKYFTLKSENEDYDDFEIPKKEIRSIWLVQGWLNRRT